MKVIINPLGNILYKSFYIYALEQLFGKHNVSYSSAPFCDLSPQLRNGRDILFVVQQKHALPKHYYISCNDSYQINDEIYQWADVYGSVNANRALTDAKYHSKLVSLCPSFAVRCWTSVETCVHALADFRLAAGMSRLRNFIGNHKRLMMRPTYQSYEFILSRCCSQHIDNNDFIFTCNTLWYNDEWNHNDEGVNMWRAHFIRACHKITDLVFEGGLVSQGKERSSEDKFADCLTRAYSMSEWMEKTKQSAVVFNTPAFWNCHGWKLGEYMAMGKCILSTSLSNDLPAPLIHGENIHFVEKDIESMEDAIRYILQHPDYRHRLENGIRAYWQKYGTPQASLKLLGLG